MLVCDITTFNGKALISSHAALQDRVAVTRSVGEAINRGVFMTTLPDFSTQSEGRI